MALALGLAAAAVLIGCGREPASAAKPGAGIDWRSCRLPRVSQAAKCATIAVPELRGAEKPGSVRLHVAVVPAISATPQPDPLYFIAGGPGQGASEVAFQALPALGRIRRSRDLVFVDVRGTGRSEALKCDLFDSEDALERLFDERFPKDELAACIEAHKGRRLGGYRTAAIVADLVQVADRLGHAKVNVYGISYGTRVALQWLRQDANESGAKRLRSVILDGVAPPPMVLFSSFARDAQAAFDKLADDCLADRGSGSDGKGCGDRFGDVRKTLKMLLEASDPPVTATVIHPTEGREVRVELRRAGVAMAVRSLMYSADLQALLPLALHDAARGDAGPLVTQALTLAQGAADASSFGMMFAVVCAEDVPYIRPADIAAEASTTVFGAVIAEQMRQVCRAWPGDRSAPLNREPVRSEVPTLLLSGALDPVTPARWGSAAARTLSNSAHVLVPAAGHGTFGTGCVPRLMGEFVGAASVDALDTSCVNDSKRPPFFIARTGPAP